MPAALMESNHGRGVGGAASALDHGDHWKPFHPYDCSTSASKFGVVAAIIAITSVSGATTS